MASRATNWWIGPPGSVPAAIPGLFASRPPKYGRAHRGGLIFSSACCIELVTIDLRSREMCW
jgi:hypothetical protein